MPESYQDGKIMGTIFWDVKEYMLVHFPSRKETVSAVCYVQMLQKLLHALCDKHPIHSST
jgi:hypothetical protein